MPVAKGRKSDGTRQEVIQIGDRKHNFLSRHGSVALIHVESAWKVSRGYCLLGTSWQNSRGRSSWNLRKNTSSFLQTHACN